MFLQLALEGLVRYGTPVVRVGVLEHGYGEVVYLLFTELHTILFHARPHHVLQFSGLDQAVP